MEQQITPNLWFDDNAQEAVDFYVSTFAEYGSKINSTANYQASAEEGLAPFQLNRAGKVLTIDFTLADLRFTAINAGPTFKFNPAISLILHFDPARDEKAREHLDELWAKLNEGKEALMPLGTYPFSECYGWTRDRYGLTWQLILKSVTPPRPFIMPALMFCGKNVNRAEEAINFYSAAFGGWLW